jgi:hypothetical protein
MRFPSPALAATLRALHGEPDVHVIAPAFSNRQFARILALAPGVDPVIGALGALAGEVPDLLTPGAIESPALHAAIASLIGTDVGDRVLEAWAWVAPAGWGAPHDAALINAVHNNRCAPWVAAALIGPTNDAAALLRLARDIAVTIRRWGQATPNDPTAWMNTLSPEQQDRLLNELRHTPVAVAFCLSWLPCSLDAGIADLLSDEGARWRALNAYASASPVACTRHADILSALMQHANWFYLDPLTRLAVTSRMGDVWTAVVHLLRKSPNDVNWVVAAAPWDALHPDVQETILSAAAHDATCAAIAFARGMRTQPPSITQKTARAFFAAVAPTVWNALPKEKQRAWLSLLYREDSYLAVRSLGLDPAFLACADLDADVIAAVRRHAPNEETLRWMLLPMAVRDLPIADLPAVVVALPPMPDPAAFVQIAGGMQAMPLALRNWVVTNPTPQALVAPITVLRTRAEAQLDRDTPANRCTALTAVFAGRSSEEAMALLAALPDDVYTMLHPAPDALANTLAHPDRRDAFRQTLDTITALSPSVAISALHALDALTQATKPFSQRQAGASLAQALRNHGDGFLALVDTLADAPRTAILPPPQSEINGVAIRAIAAADPLVAHHLAHALRSPSPTAVLDALAAASDTLTRIWHLLPDALRQSVLGDRYALASAAAAPGGADALMQTLRAWEEDNNPLPLLALRMLIDDDARRQERGVAILAQQPDLAVSLLPLFRDDLRTTLASNPAIAIASADLPPLRSPTPAPMRRRRR